MNCYTPSENILKLNSRTLFIVQNINVNTHVSAKVSVLKFTYRSVRLITFQSCHLTIIVTAAFPLWRRRSSGVGRVVQLVVWREVRPGFCDVVAVVGGGDDCDGAAERGDGEMGGGGGRKEGRV